MVASTIDPTGVHVFHTDLIAKGDGTDIWDLFRYTPGVGSGHRKLDLITIGGGPRFVYGLDAETTKATCRAFHSLQISLRLQRSLR